MSVQCTNQASQVIVSTAFSAGASAWAATAMASPIGAVGGALYGTVALLSRVPIGIFNRQCLHVNHPLASGASKTLAQALLVLGPLAAAWAALAMVGFTLAAKEIVVLLVVSYVCAIGLAFALECLGIDVKSL